MKTRRVGRAWHNGCRKNDGGGGGGGVLAVDSITVGTS